MSPAGSGGGQFRGLGPRVNGGKPAPLVSVCTWMLPWLLPAGLLGTVVLISLPSVFACLFAGIWGWLVLPYLAAYIRAHARADPGNGHANGVRGGEMDYWRTRLM
jgi:hypothetical protein